MQKVNKEIKKTAKKGFRIIKKKQRKKVHKMYMSQNATTTTKNQRNTSREQKP